MSGRIKSFSFFLTLLIALISPFILRGQHYNTANDAAELEREARNNLNSYVGNRIRSKYGANIIYINDPEAMELFQGQTLNMQVTLYGGSSYFVAVAGDKNVQIARITIFDKNDEEVNADEKEYSVGPMYYVVFSTKQTAVYNVKISLDRAEGNSAWIAWTSGEISKYGSSGGGDSSSSDDEYDYGDY